MATRPIFIPRPGRGPLVEELNIDIRWHGGFAVSQKQKNIQELHRKAAELGVFPILEISTKSEVEIGRRLSAFSLKIHAYGAMKSLESAYQASKVFRFSGQHEYVVDLGPYDAKKEIRNVGEGEIIAFRFEGVDYPTEPKNAFYDWLYLRAIAPHEGWIKDNLNYKGYSDIEFTPGKSINCQGRAFAEFHALSMRGDVGECTNDFETFRNILRYSQRDNEI